MIFILHRYIFRELFKIFVLSSLALTVMLSLGMSLRPIQQFGVGPLQVIHLLGYFVPITLTFVLPMGALFAASLVYGRFASDNELDACRASGIGMSSLVYPGLFLALIVAIANLVLSFYVVPAYVHRAEKAIKADAKQILFRNITRNGYYDLPGGKYQIYADTVDMKNDNLIGVVILEAKDGRVKKLITAQTAHLKFDIHKRRNSVTIIAQNAYQLDSSGGGYVKQIPITGNFQSLMKDSIKFQKIDEIKKIRANAMNFYPIEQLAFQCFWQFTAERLADHIKTTIQTENKKLELENENSIVQITATDCLADSDGEVELLGPIQVIRYDKNTSDIISEYTSTKAYLEFDRSSADAKMVLTVPNARWIDIDNQEYIKFRFTVSGLGGPAELNLARPENILAAVLDKNNTANSSVALKNLVNQLSVQIKKTWLEIQAEIHSRLVFGIGCVILILIGIGLGIKLKGGHLLTAFGASSVPAAALIVCIMMGKNITKNQQSTAGSGVIFMWAGLAGLGLWTFWLYRKLLKN